MNKSELLKLELAKRKHPMNILDECFDKQREFILSPAKRKILCLTRRSGKSTAVAINLIDIALKKPRSKLLYINTTKGEAKNTMWQNIFEEIFMKRHIDADLIDSKNEIRFSNGSIIYLHGVDATPKEKNKIRGKKYELCCVDECQNYTQDIKTMIENDVGPTLADANASIIMIGTPGNKLGDNYWYQINRDDSDLSKGWTKFHWTWKDNPFVRANMEIYLNSKIEANPNIINDPGFRQEYMGEWVIETSIRCYKSNEFNFINSPPPNLFEAPTYILSIDLGYYDATAFVIGAYNRYLDTNLYILESFKQSKLTISGIAAIIKELRHKYKFAHIVVDAANTQAVEEMRQIHQIPMVAADKLGKEGHIALLNSDFNSNNIRIVKATNEELKKELDTLIWDEQALLSGKHKENAKYDNHLTDALLYCHHFSRHYWYKPVEPILNLDNKEDLFKLIEKNFIQKDRQSLIGHSIFETETDEEFVNNWKQMNKGAKHNG